MKIKRSKLRIIMVLAIIASSILISACKFDNKSVEASTNTVNVISNLKHNGIGAEYLHAFDSDYLNARGYIILIENTPRLWVYEFGSERVFDRAVERILHDPNPSREMGNPIYFIKDDFIVCYDGMDQKVIAMLNDTMDEQISPR